jgi:hypothetical protein
MAQNAEIARRFYREVIDEGRLEVIDELCAEDFVELRFQTITLLSRLRRVHVQKERQARYLPNQLQELRSDTSDNRSFLHDESLLLVLLIMHLQQKPQHHADHLKLYNLRRRTFHPREGLS